MNLVQAKIVSNLKKQLFRLLNEVEIRSFNRIYSTMHDPNIKNRLHKVQMDYHTLLTSRSHSEKMLIKRIFKDAGYYSIYRKDVLTLIKQKIIK